MTSWRRKSERVDDQPVVILFIFEHKMVDNRFSTDWLFVPEQSPIRFVPKKMITFFLRDMFKYWIFYNIILQMVNNPRSIDSLVRQFHITFTEILPNHPGFWWFVGKNFDILGKCHHMEESNHDDRNNMN